jgi:hypothetical protein
VAWAKILLPLVSSENMEVSYRLEYDEAYLCSYLKICWIRDSEFTCASHSSEQTVDSVWASLLKFACLFALLLLTDGRMTTQGWIGFKQKRNGGETYLDIRCEARWQRQERTSTTANKNMLGTIGSTARRTTAPYHCGREIQMASWSSCSEANR